MSTIFYAIVMTVLVLIGGAAYWVLREIGAIMDMHNDIKD